MRAFLTESESILAAFVGRFEVEEEVVVGGRRPKSDDSPDLDFSALN